MRDPVVAEVIEKAGGVGILAEKLGVASQAISQWKRVPVLRVLDVERITEVPRTKLRPDVYPADAA